MKNRIYILTEDGVSIRAFSINEMKKAKKIWQEMCEYHQRNFKLKIIEKGVK